MDLLQVCEWPGVLRAFFKLRRIWWQHLPELCADKLGGNPWKYIGY